VGKSAAEPGDRGHLAVDEPEDQKKKRDIYERIGVEEYTLFDPCWEYGFDELSRVQVSASGPAGGQLGQVDYQGVYRIEALPAGDWIVEAMDSGTGRRAVGRVRLEPGQTQAELDLDFGER
jgi:hypothetical protein